MKEVLILQHVAVEGPGLIAKALDRAGVSWRVKMLLTEDRPRLPEITELSGVVLMGGPMDAGDLRTFPALGLEQQLVREAVAVGLPVLGVCLGHQLIALSLGAEVDYGATREIGVAPVQASGELAFLDELEVLHWHTDNAGLPVGAQRLASTGGCANQAFRYGSALGLQFHLELDDELLSEWLKSGMDGDLETESAEELMSSFKAQGVLREQLAARIFDDFALSARAQLSN